MARKQTVDFRSFKKKSKADRPKGAAVEFERRGSYWWKETKNVNEALWDVLRHLEPQQNARMAQNLKHLRMYSDREAFGLSPAAYVRMLPTNPANRDRVTFNVIRMAIDTLGAKIAKNRPKATFVTDGGDWHLQQRAKGLDKFCQGVAYQACLPTKNRAVFRDACIMDIGATKFYRDPSNPKRICADRVLPIELYSDEADGLYGEPRQLFQVRGIPREVLKEQHPDMVDLLERSEQPRVEMPGMNGKTLSDYALVVEAWHLPSGPNAKDGRHVIAVSNAVLLDEEWTRDEFPFAFFRWSERPFGFWGQGVAEQLEGVQLSINKKLKAVNAMLHLLSVPRVYVEETSDVVTATLNNEIGAIVKYRGQPPQVVATNAVPPELWDSIERDKARAFELVGVSQLSVASKKPAGLDSGAALREYNDTEAERFVLVGQAWEDYHLEQAKQIIALAKEIAAEDGDDFDVTVETRGSLEVLKWKEVQLEDDAYVLKMMPTSSLPTTPAARQQTVMDWMQAGWIDPREARRLMDMPDLEASNNAEFAAAEDIENCIADILESGTYQTPEPYQDLVYGVKRFQSAYLRAKRMNVPEKRRGLLLRWMDEASAMLQQAQTAAMPPPGAAPSPQPQPAAPPAQPVAA
jgi:hypothetical protein